MFLIFPPLPVTLLTSHLFAVYSYYLITRITFLCILSQIFPIPLLSCILPSHSILLSLSYQKHLLSLSLPLSHYDVVVVVGDQYIICHYVYQIELYIFKYIISIYQVQVQVQVYFIVNRTTQHVITQRIKIAFRHTPKCASNICNTQHIT